MLFSLKNFKNKKYLLKSTQGVPLPFLSNEWQVLCDDVIPEPFFSMHGIGNEHEVSPYCCHMTSDVITKWLVQYRFPLYLGNSLSGFGDGRSFTLSTEEKGQESTLALNPLTWKKEAKLRISLIIEWISTDYFYNLIRTFVLRNITYIIKIE